MSQYMFMCQKEDPLQIQPRYGLTKNGGCILANNSSNIPQKELKDVLQALRDLDVNYKNGLIDLEVGLEAILCNYCS